MWFAFGVILGARVLFLLTFPLNDLGGDTSNYADMLRRGTSSLVHAGGYPFLIGLPFRTGLLSHLSPGVVSYTILVTQHLVDLSVVVLLYCVIRHIFGPLSALIAAVFVGTNFQSLGATSATYPEWLQADLLVVALALLYYGYAHSCFRLKATLYAAAAFAFTWCILVKFNAAVLGFVFPVVILADSLTGRQRAVVASVCLAVASITCALYVVFHHRPSTGTFTLTYDKSWVLLTRVQQVFSNRLDPENGPNTRRWLALSGVLPRSYQVAGPSMFSHVDAVPAEIRAPYRSQYAHLLTADDVTVERVRSKTTLPDGFIVGLSAIPVGYYIGLPESERLGVRVAVEAFAAKPSVYASAMKRDFLNALTRWPADAPFPTSVGMLREFGMIPDRPLALGYVHFRQRPDYPAVPFSYSVPVLSRRGVRIISWVNEAAPPASMITFLAGLGMLIAVMQIVQQRRVEERQGITLLLGVVVLVLIVVSVATLSFRWKEARLVAPLVAVPASFAVATLVSAAVRVAQHLRMPRVSANETP